MSIQLKGSSTLIQDHRKSVLKPGDMALYDTTRPYDLNIHNNNEQFVIEVPRKICEQTIVNPQKITASKLSQHREEAKLCNTFLNSIYLSNSSTEGKLRELLNLFSDAFQSTTPSTNIYELNHQSSRLVMIKDFVIRNLDNEFLDQTTVANKFNISRRYLNQLFEHETVSFSEWIRNSRLKKCSEDLLRPELQHFSVIDIAYKWGFKDPAHFSRLFKKHFKITARDYRKLNTGKIN